MTYDVGTLAPARAVGAQLITGSGQSAALTHPCSPEAETATEKHTEQAWLCAKELYLWV